MPYRSGKGTGFTSPQSALLKTDDDWVVHSTGLAFGRAWSVPTKWSVPLAWSPSTIWDSIIPLPLIAPVHTQSAVMPPPFLTTLVTWHPRVRGTMAPYLSISCCVRQTSVVCVPPAEAELASPPGGNGDCCQVWAVVNSQRPAFLLCARTETVKAKKQHPNTIEIRFLRIISYGSRCYLALTLPLNPPALQTLAWSPSAAYPPGVRYSEASPP